MTIRFKYKGKNHILHARPDRDTEVSTVFLQANGIKRNLLKFQVELAWARGNRTPASHGYFITAALNWLTENFRYAPYTWAHIVFIGVPVLMLIEGGLVWVILH